MVFSRVHKTYKITNILVRIWDVITVIFWSMIRNSIFQGGALRRSDWLLGGDGKKSTTTRVAAD